MNCPIIAQLNINPIKNKFQFFKKEVCANLDIPKILKTKLDDSFPSAQFYSMGFRNYIDHTDARMMREFSSTLGIIFPHVYFQIQLILKAFWLRLVSDKRNG